MELRSKKPVLILTLLLLSLRAVAQIPYYAGTVGNGKLYGYTSVKATVVSAARRAREGTLQ